MYELIEYTQCTFLKQNIHMGGVRYHADSVYWVMRLWICILTAAAAVAVMAPC